MNKGDMIRLTKPMGAFKNVGEICEVINVTESNDIEFRFGGVNLGYMSQDEFEKYFELVEFKDEPVDNDESDDFECNNEELKELYKWCKENDKPFIPKLYYNIIEKRKDINKPILRMYTNRLCLAQYRHKTFKDSVL